MTGDQARALEPLISDQARAALHFPDDGIIDSIRLTIGYAELAARNGVDVLRGAPVHAIERDGDRIVARRGRRPADRDPVRRERGRRRGGHDLARWPAASSSADVAAAGPVLAARPRAGRPLPQGGGRRADTGHTAASTACPPPTARCCWGRPRSTTRTAADRAVDTETLDHVFDAAQRLVPSIGRELRDQDVRRQPPGVRHHLPDRRRRRRSRTWCTRPASARPGCRRSPAVAEMVHDLLAGLGAPVGDERPDAVTALEPLPRLLGHPSPEQLFARDPRYGQVVCACEQVTAAEIAAVHGMARAARLARGRCASAPGRPAAAARARSAWPASRSCTRCTPAGGRSRSPSRSRGATLGVGADDA